MTAEFCRQQNSLPKIADMMSRDLLHHHLSPFPDHADVGWRALQEGKMTSSCLFLSSLWFSGHAQQHKVLYVFDINGAF